MPDRLVVTNTSPLLYLHQIGQLDLLRRLYRKVVVPGAVIEELASGASLGFDVPKPDSFAWLEIASPPERLLVPAVVDLGAGEAEVIAFGVAVPNALLLLDDQLARRLATVLDLQFTGTLGILVKAKLSGVLESISPCLDALQETSIRVSPELIQWALQEADESQPPPSRTM